MKQQFYCTFNFDSKLTGKAVLKVSADTENQAREYMAQMFKPAWGGIYPAEKYTPKAEAVVIEVEL